ncbi:hypothetical protein [Gordonia terrae]|uniref:hypothetical protein n=1 Tax=Gordonia terrae TaxID=2055 RepID=UPI00117CB22A|nr:hypothetical protein [Gordonia terrae]
MATAFVERVKASYYSERDAQLDRAEAYAIGYDRELDAFFTEVEPRVLYKDILARVAAELRAERAAERAELEFWQDAERAHYAAWVDDAAAEDVTEDITRLFRTRFLALVWSAVCRPRRVVGVPVARRPLGVVSRRAAADRCTRPGGRRGPDVVADRDLSGGRGPPAGSSRHPPDLLHLSPLLSGGLHHVPRHPVCHPRRDPRRLGVLAGIAPIVVGAHPRNSPAATW